MQKRKKLYKAKIFTKKLNTAKKLLRNKQKKKIKQKRNNYIKNYSKINRRK